MEIFKKLEEIKPYYNKETNTYIFSENNRLIDIKIDFDLNIECSINALDIKALNINARYINTGNINASNIKAYNINAWDIKAGDISAWDIKAGDIKAYNINAWDIKAGDISAWDIKACDIKARNINAWDIQAENINSNNIQYNSVCYARKKFVCNSIKGARPNSKHFCLDSEIVIRHSEDICVQK